MVTNACSQLSISKATLMSPLLVPISDYRNPILYIPTRHSSKLVLVKASSMDSSKNLPPPFEGKNILAFVLDVPRAVWRRILQPLGDFGFGKRSIWEGSVGLFVASGVVLLALSLVWLRGSHLRSQSKKYQVVVEFSHARGICLGTPVRIRGITVGSVVGVESSLRSVDAVIEVEDTKIIIPRNSVIEVNQSGLLMETLIDITPRDPLPATFTIPLHPDCAKEGLIVCDRERIRGHQGVSLDELVGVFFRLGREMEKIGVRRSYVLAEKVASIVQEAHPLLAKIEATTEDIQSLLAEVHDTGILKDIEYLTKSLAETAENLRKVHSSILTPRSTELIQQSIRTLVLTLKNIENISLDISYFLHDEATRKDLKSLIKSLSRIL